MMLKYGINAKQLSEKKEIQLSRAGPGIDILCNNVCRAAYSPTQDGRMAQITCSVSMIQIESFLMIALSVSMYSLQSLSISDGSLCVVTTVCMLISVGTTPRPAFVLERSHVTRSPFVPPVPLVSPKALPWVTLMIMLEN